MHSVLGSAHGTNLVWPLGWLGPFEAGGNVFAVDRPPEKNLFLLLLYIYYNYSNDKSFVAVVRDYFSNHNLILEQLLLRERRHRREHQERRPNA